MRDWVKLIGAGFGHGLGTRQGRGLAVLLALIVLLGAVLPPAPARAAAAPPGALHPCIARQALGDTAERLLASPARFDCRRSDTSWGPGSFWILFRIAPDPAASAAANAADGAPPPVLRFTPQWQRGLTVSTRDIAGHILTRQYDDADLGTLTMIGDHVALPLSGHDLPLRDILVRVDGAMNAGGMIVNPALVRHGQIHADELIATAVFAAFAGLGIGLLCYNIVLWLTIRERFQLTYCLSLLAMLAYAWASSGAMTMQFPGIPNTVRLGTCYVMLAFVAALALQFITDFIEPGKLPHRLRRTARQAGLGSIVAALAVVMAPPEWVHLANRIYVLSFIPLPLLVAAMTVIGWRRGSRSIRVLAIAWALPMAVAVARILYALHIVELGAYVQYSLVAAMSVEALLSSLAMSARIKFLTHERDEARADERAARHLANVDSLTGLLNRRALLEQVIAWSSPEPLRLLLVDIDRFKLVNDQHGHLVGDDVLREVAQMLAMRADLRGTVARLGGEEFALIGTAAELGEGMALGILADMRSRPMVHDVSVTVSVGMADGMVRCKDEWRELYRRADAALYDAKSGGRNRAVHAAPCSANAADTTAAVPLQSSARATA